MIGPKVDNSSRIIFDKQKIKNNSKTINYLFGQLFDVHADNLVLYASNSMKNYNNNIWTNNNAIVMELLHLGVINDSIAHFSDRTHVALIGNTVLPTLSPKDPNFAEWYKGYEAKMKKAERPTPDER